MTGCLGIQTNQLQNVGNTLPDLPIPGADDTHGECHVVVNGLVGNESEILEHDANGAAHEGDLVLTDTLQ